MALPSKLEQALNYKWHQGNIDTLHRLLIGEVLELKRRLNGCGEPPSHDAPKVVDWPQVKPTPQGVSLYDSEPDGLEDE